MADRPPLWPIFVAYVGAFAAIVALSLIAGGIVRVLNPLASRGRSPQIGRAHV